MPGRRTGRPNGGKVLEETIMPSLLAGGYQVAKQHAVALASDMVKYVVDAMCVLRGRSVLISCKWQDSKGTAEQKIAFDVLQMSAALAANPHFACGYIVIAGEGWSQRVKDYCLSGRLQSHVANAGRIVILKLEQFIARALRGKL